MKITDVSVTMFNWKSQAWQTGTVFRWQPAPWGGHRAHRCRGRGPCLSAPPDRGPMPTPDRSSNSSNPPLSALTPSIVVPSGSACGR